jgi:hypothetical protein
VDHEPGRIRQLHRRARWPAHTILRLENVLSELNIRGDGTPPL